MMMMMSLPPSSSSQQQQAEAPLQTKQEQAIPKLQQQSVLITGQQVVTPRPKKKSNDVRDYLELVERVARAEYRRIPAHMVEMEELISIGALAVQNIVNAKKTQEAMAKLNISYMATAIRWAIRNEVRVRLKWYTLKHKSSQNEEEQSHNNTEDVRGAVYETILSIDAMMTSEDGQSTYDAISDGGATPEEELEVTELGKAVKKAVQTLPARDRYVMEARFYQNKQVKDIAEELGLSSSRITRIVQSSLQFIRRYLKERLYIQEEA